eukprot:2056960-Rhodomonas_salina.1
MLIAAGLTWSGEELIRWKVTKNGKSGKQGSSLRLLRTDHKQVINLPNLSNTVLPALSSVL